jgi:DNA-binding transcriptional MerR regulator
MFTIGELARLTEVASSTIRYYEREGLLSPAARSDGNFRLYDQAEVARLRFIRAAQDLGFTLKDVRKILNLPVTDHQTCACVQTMIQERLDNLEILLGELEHTRESLRRHLTRCQNTPEHSCTLIEHLADRAEGA